MWWDDPRCKYSFSLFTPRSYQVEFCLLIGSNILCHVFRGEKQECKFFDQLVHIFGNRYITNSDPLTDNTAEVIGKSDIIMLAVFWCFSSDSGLEL